MIDLREGWEETGRHLGVLRMEMSNNDEKFFIYAGSKSLGFDG